MVLWVWGWDGVGGNVIFRKKSEVVFFVGIFWGGCGGAKPPRQDGPDVRNQFRNYVERCAVRCVVVRAVQCFAELVVLQEPRKLKLKVSMRIRKPLISTLHTVGKEI